MYTELNQIKEEYMESLRRVGQLSSAALYLSAWISRVMTGRRSLLQRRLGKLWGKIMGVIQGWHEGMRGHMSGSQSGPQSWNLPVKLMKWFSGLSSEERGGFFHLCIYFLGGGWVWMPKSWGHQRGYSSIAMGVGKELKYHCKLWMELLTHCIR